MKPHAQALESRRPACDLFHRCLEERGDEPWYQFQKHYGRYLKRVVRRTVRRHFVPLAPQELEDLVQDLFCRVLAGHRQSFFGHSDRQLWAYFSQVVFSLLVDRYRHFRLRKKRLMLIRGGAGLEWLPTELELDRVSTPEDVALRREEWRQLAALAVLVVRPDRRALELGALRMALFEGYSSREIAQATGGRLTPQRIDRLVSRLRKRLSAAGLDLPRRSTSHSDFRNLRSRSSSGPSSPDPSPPNQEDDQPQRSTP